MLIQEDLIHISTPLVKYSWVGNCREKTERYSDEYWVSDFKFEEYSVPEGIEIFGMIHNHTSYGVEDYSLEIGALNSQAIPVFRRGFSTYNARTGVRVGDWDWVDPNQISYSEESASFTDLVRSAKVEIDRILLVWNARRFGAPV